MSCQPSTTEYAYGVDAALYTQYVLYCVYYIAIGKRNNNEGQNNQKPCYNSVLHTRYLAA